MTSSSDGSVSVSSSKKKGYGGPTEKFIEGVKHEIIKRLLNIR